MISRVCVAAVVALLLVLDPAGAASNKMKGKIKKFECGDNCYLTIVTAGGGEVTALCAAKSCLPWNEVAEMPAKLVGRRVTVTLGVGTQLYGDGSEVGDYPAFTSVKVH